MRVLVVILLSLFVANIVQAQAVLTPEQRAEASTVFAEGIAAAEAGNWVESRRAFDHVYQLTGRAEVLLNLAVAQEQGGLLLEARASYQAFLAQAAPELRAEHQVDVEARIGDLSARMPHLEITVTPTVAESELEVDGVPTSSMSMEVNPGPHHVVLRIGGHESDRETSVASERQVSRVALTAVPSLAASPPSSGEPDIVLIAILSGGGALVLGGVILGVVLGTQGGGTTMGDPVFNGSLGSWQVR